MGALIGIQICPKSVAHSNQKPLTLIRTIVPQNARNRAVHSGADRSEKVWEDDFHSFPKTHMDSENHTLSPTLFLDIHR